VRVFKDVDDFLTTPSSIMNRRKSRAGRSLENHFDYFLTRAAIPHVIRPHEVVGKPDIVFPRRKKVIFVHGCCLRCTSSAITPLWMETKKVCGSRF
jgi:G:T-mismatch repair DNA endonuclease (very short patch repair protein)